MANRRITCPALAPIESKNARHFPQRIPGRTSCSRHLPRLRQSAKPSLLSNSWPLRLAERSPKRNVLIVPSEPPSSISYRGRLAPSPTGFLHLGHARTFWIAQQRT